MKSKKPRYIYGRDCEGCNDLFVIQDTKTGRDIACTIYWNDEPAWAKRAEQAARLITEALNAYQPGKNRRA
jgi:hypothetical protein